MRRYNSYRLTIASGESLSNIQEIQRTETPAMLEIGSAWTSADLTFKVGFSTVKDLFKDGNEYTISGIAANRTIILPLTDFVGVKNIQVRSGTSGSAVNQGGTREITFITIEL